MMTAIDLRNRIRSPEPAFMQRIRLRALRRVLWLRTLWADSADAPGQGLAISHAEIDRLLLEPWQLAEAESAFYESDAAARKLGQPIAAADRRMGEDQTWDRLRSEFSLTDPESDLLSLAVAVEVEPSLRRVYGYLNDEAAACYPTALLASSLFQWPPGTLISPESALIRWRLARMPEAAGNPWNLTAPWVADPPVVWWSVRGSGSDPTLGTAVHCVSRTENLGRPCLYPEILAGMEAFVRVMRKERDRAWSSQAPGTPIELELVGLEGAGKRTLAAQFCALLGEALVSVDASLLLGGDVPLAIAIERAIRAVRTARLAQGVLYWHAADTVDPRVWQAVRGYAGLMLFGARAPFMGGGHALWRSFRLPSLTWAQRAALWRHFTGQPLPETVADWRLTPAEIENAARLAATGTEVVAEACRQMLYQAPGELFSPLVCPYTWEDIVLPAGVRQHLAELEEQARLRWPVYEGWGFAKLCPLGKGITALFAGPSGTGKTMAAQVLARSLQRDLYRIDLAGVVNKYIGETEKRLKQVFDACERAGVILFFDEADALFGQRTQVKDAHDRFANIEIDYLLQRMEQFDGIAILATNRKSDLDTAFLRRLRFIVDFLPPGPTERLALWKLALPPCSPEGEALLDRIDWEFLADKLNMTGADIKSAALSAAFLAHAEGMRIKMAHILYAARREMIKHGVMPRLGDWENQGDWKG